MSLTAKIDTFITDAKDVIANLTIEMQSFKKKHAFEWQQKYQLRRDLLHFMELIKPEVLPPSDDDNYLLGAGWENETEIEAEIDHWREIGGMDPYYGSMPPFKSY
jgi:hypothetical protein